MKEKLYKIDFLQLLYAITMASDTSSSFTMHSFTYIEKLENIELEIKRGLGILILDNFHNINQWIEKDSYHQIKKLYKRVINNNLPTRMRSYHKDEVRIGGLQMQIFLETEVKKARVTVQTLTESAETFLHTQMKWIDTWAFDINYSLQFKDN